MNGLISEWVIRYEQKEHLLVNKHNAKKSYYEGIKNQDSPAVSQVKYIEVDDKLMLCSIIFGLIEIQD